MAVSFNLFARGDIVDINDQIKSQLEENPVIIYMKGTPQAPQCGFSSRTVQALMGCGERFAFVNILDNQELREALKTYSNWPTYPQLYINGELVGGCDIVLELSESGELAEMVKGAANRQEA
ncbi:monothiol glutaredoxin [Marinobacter daqiaonensis]|uniref:Glutaredoxin n=1 Tax=Marinobacter daqiaonensis TaxID=650891 RepID=A0A1I6J713_9GAMM|nr:monothiol glutaredoxin [Marinobacter daqiaonensis]